MFIGNDGLDRLTQLGRVEPLNEGRRCSSAMTFTMEGSDAVESWCAQRRPTVFIGNDTPPCRHAGSTLATLNEGRRCSSAMTNRIQPGFKPMAPLNEGRRCSSAMTPVHPSWRTERCCAQRRPTVFIGNDDAGTLDRATGTDAQRRPTVFIGNDDRAINTT